MPLPVRLMRTKSTLLTARLYMHARNTYGRRISEGAFATVGEEKEKPETRAIDERILGHNSRNGKRRGARRLL